VDLGLTVLQITAPIFALAAVGLVWVRLGIDYPLAFVTRLTMTLSVPCLIFVALMETEIDPRALTALSLASLAAYGAVGATLLAAAVVLRLELRTYLAPLVFGNTGNVGLPLALFAFGEEGLGLAVVVFAVMAVLSFTVGIWVVAGGGSPLAALKEPLVAATLAGGACLWFGLTTPPFVTETLRLTGQMAIPLMLITLGVAMARLRPAGLGRPGLLSALKVAVCVGAAWWVGRAFELPPVAFAVLVLQVATPVAVTSYLLAQIYGADADAVAGLVVVSTAMSVVALPLLLAVLL
jgi:predicted permease